MLSLSSFAMASDIAGQGIPRKTSQDCTTAQSDLEKKLQARGFTKIQTGCSGISEDTGEFVPTLTAKHDERVKLDNSIARRRSNAAECQDDLEALTLHIKSDRVLEGECLVGFEQNDDGSLRTFYQAWTTQIVSLEGETLVKDENDADRRRPKEGLAPTPREFGPLIPFSRSVR